MNFNKFKRIQEQKAQAQAEKDLSEIRELIKESKKLLKSSLILPKIEVTENKNLKKYVNKLETNGINFNF